KAGDVGEQGGAVRVLRQHVSACQGVPAIHRDIGGEVLHLRPSGPYKSSSAGCRPVVSRPGKAYRSHSYRSHYSTIPLICVPTARPCCILYNEWSANV